MKDEKRLVRSFRRQRPCYDVAYYFENSHFTIKTQYTKLLSFN